MADNHAKYFIHYLILGILIACFLQIFPCNAQENVNELIKDGAKLNEDEIAQLNKILETNLENLAIRTKLLSYYFENKMNSDLKRKAYQNHLIWIIQNRFDAEVLGERIAHVSFHDSSFYNKIKRLWLKQTETHHKNAAVLGNGAEFFLGAGIEIQTDTSKKIINIITNFDKPYLYPELDLAEKLLKKAQNIQPDNTKWSRKLAKYYEQMTKYKSGEERTKAAEKALEQLEITLDQTDNEKKRFILISRTVNVAFQADKLAEAKSYAQELLELSPKYSEDKHYYGKAVHQGNLILGKIALKENDLEKATKYLIEAGKTTGGPQLNYLGPDTTLAKQLLAAGERKAVIQYFRLCANFWKRGSDRLKSWIAAIEGGDIPVFDLNLEGMNTAIFTTGLNERNRPIDNIEEISITADRIYIFTYWHNISPEKHDYLCNMYDAAERLVFQHKMDINPKKDKYYTWTYHSLNKFAEKPGEWRFEIYLDGKKEIEKYLVVLNKVGQPFAKNTVRIAGKVTNLKGKPPVMAHVHLTSFHGNYRHTFRTVAAGKDGLYSMDVYWPGLYRLFVTAVNHGHISIPIIIYDETQEIELDVKLAPLVYNDEFDVVRIVGDWNHPYDFTDADTMQKQADGTFVYERQVEADTIFYQLIGITKDPPSVSGTQSDYYVYRPVILYCSVLKVKPGTVKIVFNPKKLNRNSGEIHPQITFAKQNARQQKIWEIDHIVQEQKKKYQVSAREYRKTENSMRDFHFDWSKAVEFLKERMCLTSDKFVQQFSAIQLAQLPVYRPGLEWQTVLEIADLIPPNSEIWSYEPLLPSSFAYKYGMAMANQYLNTFINENPDRVVRGTSLAQFLMRIKQEGDQETTARYYEKLKSEYGDLREIQPILRRLDPDKRILAGKPVPDFEEELLDTNEMVSNKSLLGKFYMMDFWAVWCGPCIAEMENLHAAYEKFNKENFTILSLSFDRKLQDVENFRKEKWEMPWLNVFIEGGFGSPLGKTFEVFGIPKPILVGPDGKIIEVGNALRGESLEKTLANCIKK